MLKLLPLLLSSLVLGGCQTGYLMDRFGDREQVLAPQLARFGLSQQEARCLGERLARRLSLGQLRALEIRARNVRQGLSNPDRLTMNDLTIAANGMGDPEVRLELDSSASACGVRPTSLSVATAVPARRIADGPAPPGPAAGAERLRVGRVLSGAEAEALFAGRGSSPPAVGAAAGAGGGAVLNPLWLNLGSAGSGQGIAIDGSSVEREPDARTAWFRMIDPDATPSLTWYRLRVHCAERTVEPKERRRVDAEGREVEHQVYPEGYERPTAIESGTVTEIAWLSLCT